MVEAVAKTKEFLEPKANEVLKARQDLRKVLQQKQEGQVSIYEHVVKVVDQIVMSCPDQAIERFEEVSYLIKNSETEVSEFIRCSDDRPHARHCD